jgi:hypothetical protein
VITIIRKHQKSRHCRKSIRTEICARGSSRKHLLFMVYLFVLHIVSAQWDAFLFQNVSRLRSNIFLIMSYLWRIVLIFLLPRFQVPAEPILNSEISPNHFKFIYLVGPPKRYWLHRDRGQSAGACHMVCSTVVPLDPCIPAVMTWVPLFVLRSLIPLCERFAACDVEAKESVMES